MVNKKSPAAEDKPAAKTSKKRAATKVQKAPALKENIVPEKSNQDIIAEVLETKSKNEEKKALKKEKKSAKAEAKALAKNLKKAIDTPNDDERGSKAVSPNSKIAEVRQNARRAEEKKFAALKEELGAPCETCSLTNNGCSMLSAWARAYKNIFHYAGRTSRYEYWSFMLLNYILLLLAALSFSAYIYNSLVITGNTISNAILVIGSIIVFIQMLVYLALTVRRLHDTGKPAWKGFFRPLLISAAAFIAVSALVEKYFPAEENLINNITNSDKTKIILLAALYTISGLIYGYYTLKTWLAAAFFEEDKQTNSFGAPQFDDECHKAKTLRYMVFYLMLFLGVLAFSRLIFPLMLMYAYQG